MIHPSVPLVGPAFRTSKNRFRSVWLCIASGLVAFAYTLHAETYTYSADVFPEDATPHWHVRATTDGRELSGGELVVSIPAEKRSFYGIGVVESGGKLGAGQEGWNPGDNDFTVKFKVSGKASSPEVEFFRVSASIGNGRGWSVSFYDQAVTVSRVDRKVMVDTSEPDVYTLAVRNERMTLLSEKRGVLFENIKPARFLGTGLYFGSIERNQASGESLSWTLDFLEWTTHTNSAAAGQDPL